MQAAIHSILPSASAVLPWLVHRRVLALCCAGLFSTQLALAQGEEPAPPAPPRAAIEGAIGLQVLDAPQYQGSALRKTSAVPGLYLRWGRFSLATAGNFVTRRDDEVVRGLGADLLQSDDLLLQFGLRYDPGRKTAASPDLAGFDDVKETVRARLSVVWRPREDWRVSAGWSNDILGHKGGALIDFGVGREFRPIADTELTLGAHVAWGDERYMRARFGVSAEAAQRTGAPTYDPGGGWNSVGLNLQLRTDIGRRWSVWGGGSASRMLGPALDSPLVKQAEQVALGAGLAWRF